MKLRRIGLGVVATLALALTPSVAVGQSDTGSQSTVFSRLESAESWSQLSIVWDGPKLTNRALFELNAPNLAPNVLVPPPGDSGYADIYCSRGDYAFFDGNGTEHIRYNCPYKVVNWGFQISAKLRAIAISPVTESGATWYRDGAYGGKNAGHLEGAGYFFHGTFNPVYNRDDIVYWDSHVFRVNVGGATGTAHLNTGGAYEVHN